MTKFTLIHEFACAAETFWKVTFDPEMNEKMFREALAFPEYKLLDLRETDTEIVRRISVTPRLDMPAPVRKLLGAGFRYTEEMRLDRKAGVATWRTTPSALADKMRNEGTIRTEPKSAGGIRRVVDVVLDARVMLVGGLVESTAEKAIRDGYDKGAVFIARWIADRKL